MQTDQWWNLYGEPWGEDISPQAVSHPAKYSRALVRHIYEHIRQEGWANPGDLVVDPFGGVALGALDALAHGLNWVGVELEPKFVELGQANIELWNKRYAGLLPRWGKAILLQGDSRKLLQILSGEGVQMSVSSPPYSGTDLGGGAGILARDDKIRKTHGMTTDDENYGEQDGQLGNMPEGRLVLASPPYAEARIGQASGQEQCGHNDAYGQTDGQLSNLREGELVVSSPPYVDCMSNSGCGIDWTKSKPDYPGRKNHPARQQAKADAHEELNYGNADGQIGSMPEGDTEGNMGREKGDTFWSAARLVVEQCFELLVPGGHAIWVVKDYVKKKARVPFCDNWRRLCEDVGFVTLHAHQAMLLEYRGTQLDMFIDASEKIVERKSFFRRLSEKKGSPRIDEEIVLCMEKPK